MFADGRDVIVEGRYTDGELRASQVLTSCPSKYEAKTAASAAPGRGPG
jgi:cytochrome c-type biogenesis protein CcmE